MRWLVNLVWHVCGTNGPENGADTPSDQGLSPWALVGSNHRPPPCKGEDEESPTSEDSETPTSDGEKE